MKPIAVLISSILLLPSLAIVSHAQEPSNRKINCAEATTQPEINICAQKQAAEADRRLNDTYQELQNHLTDRLRQADTNQINSVKQKYQQLISGQKTWLVSRDKTCAAERSNTQDGSVAQKVYYTCMVRLTDRRIADLEKYRQ